MLHRTMTEITVVPTAEKCERPMISQKQPDTYHDLRAGNHTGLPNLQYVPPLPHRTGYTARRVLQHHAQCYYVKNRKNQRETAVMLRAVAVTLLALVLVLVMLWLVSSFRDNQAQGVMD